MRRLFFAFSALFSLIRADRYYNGESDCRDITQRRPFDIYSAKVADIPCWKFERLMSELSMLPSNAGSPYSTVDSLSYVFVGTFLMPALEGTGQRVIKECTRGKYTREEIFRNFADAVKSSVLYRDFIAATRGALDKASIKSAIFKTIDFALTHDTQQEILGLALNTLKYEERDCLNGFGSNANSALAAYILL